MCSLTTMSSLYRDPASSLRPFSYRCGERRPTSNTPRAEVAKRLLRGGPLALPAVSSPLYGYASVGGLYQRARPHIYMSSLYSSTLPLYDTTGHSAQGTVHAHVLVVHRLHRDEQLTFAHTFAHPLTHLVAKAIASTVAPQGRALNCPHKLLMELPYSSFLAFGRARPPGVPSQSDADAVRCPVPPPRDALGALGFV